MKRNWKLPLLALALLMVLGAGAFWSSARAQNREDHHSAQLQIDNHTRHSLTIEVNGRELGHIDARRKQSFEVPAGEFEVEAHNDEGRTYRKHADLRENRTFNWKIK